MDTLRAAVIGRTGRAIMGHGLDEVGTTCGREAGCRGRHNKMGLAESEETQGRQGLRLRQMLDDVKPQGSEHCQRWIRPASRPGHGLCRSRHPPVSQKAAGPTLAEADEMVPPAKKRMAKLAIAHTTRFSPRIPVVK